MIAFLSELASALPAEIGTDAYPGMWTIYVTDGSLYGEQVKCGWFALCVRDASTYVPHPVLGAVPVCTECAETVRALS